MIMPDRSLGQPTPEQGRPARASAFLTISGQPADGVVVELYDSTKRTLLDRQKTDFRGFVQFDVPISYLPVVIRPVAPPGMVSSPTDQRVTTLPVAGGIFQMKDYWTDNWDEGESVRFQIGIPGNLPGDADSGEGKASGDSFDIEKYLTLKNILIVGAVVIGGMWIWRSMSGSDD